MSETTQPITLPETQSIDNRIASLNEIALGLHVDSAESYAVAAEHRKGAKALDAFIVAEFAEPKNLTDRAHKSVCAMEKKFRVPVANFIKVVDLQLNGYDREQDRIRREKEATLRDFARKQEEERLLAEAIEAEEAGEAEEAEAILAAPVPTPLVSLPSTLVKVDGLSRREMWKGEVTSPRDFLAWLIEHPDRINEIVKFQPSGCNRLATAIKDTIIIPGFSVTTENSIASRRS